MPILKVAGGWKSDGAAQVYINESTEMKKTIATTLPIGNQAKQAPPGENSVTTRAKDDKENSGQTIVINNPANCQFHFGLPVRTSAPPASNKASPPSSGPVQVQAPSDNGSTALVFRLPAKRPLSSI
jgi:hypothetical protein